MSSYDQGYRDGKRAVAIELLRAIITDLGDDPLAKVEAMEAVASLRIICGFHGDNDWPDNLHLSDIIDKHLGDHLERYLNEPDAE